MKIKFLLFKVHICKANTETKAEFYCEAERQNRRKTNQVKKKKNQFEILVFEAGLGEV